MLLCFFSLKFSTNTSQLDYIKNLSLGLPAEEDEMLQSVWQSIVGSSLGREAKVPVHNGRFCLGKDDHETCTFGPVLEHRKDPTHVHVIDQFPLIQNGRGSVPWSGPWSTNWRLLLRFFSFVIVLDLRSWNTPANGERDENAQESKSRLNPPHPVVSGLVLVWNWTWLSRWDLYLSALVVEHPLTHSLTLSTCSVEIESEHCQSPDEKKRDRWNPPRHA